MTTKPGFSHKPSRVPLELGEEFLRPDECPFCSDGVRFLSERREGRIGISSRVFRTTELGVLTSRPQRGPFRGWELIARGKSHRGQLFFHGQARWEYGKPGPEELGPDSLGSAIGTANTFSAYQSKPVLLRNLYWQQGSQEAGWAYRIGKITSDATMSSSYEDSWSQEDKNSTVDEAVRVILAEFPPGK